MQLKILMQADKTLLNQTSSHFFSHILFQACLLRIYTYERKKKRIKIRQRSLKKLWSLGENTWSDYCPWEPSFTKLNWKKLSWVCLNLSIDCSWKRAISSEKLCSWCRPWGAGTRRLSVNLSPHTCHPKLSWRRNWTGRALIYYNPFCVPLRCDLQYTLGEQFL